MCNTGNYRFRINTNEEAESGRLGTRLVQQEGVDIENECLHHIREVHAFIQIQRLMAMVFFKIAIKVDRIITIKSRRCRFNNLTFIRVASIGGFRR